MLLFIKGILVGIAKIIPGVSGALLLINFNIYERAIDAITCFFDDWKNNLKFLILLGSGIIIAIVLCSGIVLYLLNNYKFITMMFFIGLILGGTYNFSKKIVFTNKSKLILLIIITTLYLITSMSFKNSYILKENFYDNIIFFIGGFIEIFASIVPGISGTSLLMIIGIYNQILILISNALNINYIINNINLYISYSIGMIISFIINIYIIKYLLNKYSNSTYIVVLGLSISSILILLTITFKTHITIIESIIGIMLLTLGLLISTIMNK